MSQEKNVEQSDKQEVLDAISETESFEATMEEDRGQEAQHEEQDGGSEEAAKRLTAFLEEVAKTKAELEESQKEIQEWEQRYNRLRADFDNFKRRTAKEKEELSSYATEGLVTNLLPVLDNFQRALQAMDGEINSNLLSGIEMIYRQLMDQLTKEGLELMNAVGQPFDPNYHEAVMYGPSTEEFSDGVVMDELQKGYLLKNKVIRPAMVKVAQG
ncbi:nucleotide exchange factor GrpE [Heliorestis acidaminivorans]|uniref:Protein GrpE n=1 Tax=Heliorestis acidaminivorans TaxID=553427 RepID=A0A6I0EZZ3_9FIRM|nr:nucleotide exchange factor GrpE [Heliorestis acidaminivorans]KAB2952292.1 nucleotide exchange factor GrpE [Heliorestis acidaminivorans]